MWSGRPARLEFPFEAAVGRDGVDVAIVAAKIHRAIDCNRRRHDDVVSNEERPLPCAIGMLAWMLRLNRDQRSCLCRFG